jgi:hypothetical protein
MLADSDRLLTGCRLPPHIEGRQQPGHQRVHLHTRGICEAAEEDEAGNESEAVAESGG